MTEMKTLSSEELMYVDGGSPLGYFLRLVGEEVLLYVLKKAGEFLIESAQQQIDGYYVCTDSSGNRWYSHGGGNIYIDNTRTDG